MIRRLYSALRRTRPVAGAALELAGLGLLVAAAWRVDQVLGLAAAGLAVTVVGMSMGSSSR